MSDYTPSVKREVRAAGAYRVRQGRGDHEIWYSLVSGRNFVIDGKIKSRHLANAVLSQAGLPKRFHMWAGLADGRYDASVGVLLPRQDEWLARYGASVEDLGPNWIGPAFSIHTVVRKGYAAENLPVVRLLNNYCLCGERLAAVIGLNEDGAITAGEAAAWMRANDAWVANMMGFAREYDDREDRYVTY